MTDFKRKCEGKVDDIKAKYNEKLAAKDAAIDELKEALVRAEETKNQEMETLKHSVSNQIYKEYPSILRSILLSSEISFYLSV